MIVDFNDKSIMIPPYIEHSTATFDWICCWKTLFHFIRRIPRSIFQFIHKRQSLLLSISVLFDKRLYNFNIHNYHKTT